MRIGKEGTWAIGAVFVAVVLLASALPVAFGASASGVAVSEAIQLREQEQAGIESGIVPADVITASEAAEQPEAESVAVESSAVAEPSGISGGEAAEESQLLAPRAAGIVAR
jgi:hypothetical protein